MADAKEDARAKWIRVLGDAIESDAWGQVEEATEGYTKVARSVKALEQSGEALSVSERSMLGKVYVVLMLRVKVLEEDDDDGLSLDEVRLLPDFFANMFEEPDAFPIDIGVHESERRLSDGGVITMREQRATQGGSLLPPPQPFVGGGTSLSVEIEKIGLKNALEYLDPIMTVTLVDAEGNPIESSQDTPKSTEKRENYVVFNCTAEIQSNIDELPPGWALFFEFKHYKPKKDKISTKGYAFLEADELVDGPILLEIYKKPTDFTRKKVSLLSVKKLYLHLVLTLRNFA